MENNVTPDMEKIYKKTQATSERFQPMRRGTKTRVETIPMSLAQKKDQLLKRRQVSSELRNGVLKAKAIFCEDFFIKTINLLTKPKEIINVDILINFLQCVSGFG